MSWSPRTLVVGLARRSRRPHGGWRRGDIVEVPARGHSAVVHPNVPPVHGHHCICERCQRQAGTAA